MPRAERPIVPEEGKTHRPAGWLIMFIILASIFGVPIAQLGWELCQRQRLQEFDILLKVPSLANIQSYENALKDNCVISKMVRPYLQWLQLRTITQGNEKVAIGREGWLFYKLGLFYVTGPGFGARFALSNSFAESANPVPAIVDFQRQLKERGIDLIVVPCFEKSQIYPEKLTTLYDHNIGPAANLHQQQFFKELADKGVTVLDLSDVLWKAKAQGQPLYMDMDTHWTPLGLSTFADALAKDLKNRFAWLNEPVHKFKIQPLEVSNYGDIYDMLDLPVWSGIYQKQKLTVEQVVDEATGKLVEPDPDSPVLLLGDSFANVFSVGAMKWGDHAGLAEHLALRLGRTIDVIALNGGAPTAARKALARRGDISGKKLVIWEFITRDLTDRGTAWEVFELPKDKSQTLAGPIEVKAQVEVVSKPPIPGEDTYAHCVTFTKYKVLSVEKGKYDDTELVAVQWVMRDFKLLPSASYKVGDIHHLVLVPYRKDLEPDLTQSKETDNTNDYRQPYWVKEMKQP